MVEIIILSLLLCGLITLFYREKKVEKGKIPFSIKRR